MAEKVISYRVDIKATEETRKRLIGLQTAFDKSKEALRKLNKEERQGIISSTRASKARADLTTKLHAQRNALNDQRAAILKNSSALRKNSGFVKGITKGMAGFAVQMLGVTAVIGLFSRGISSAFNIVKDFEQGQADLASVLGVSVDGIQELTANAKALGATTVFTATQVLELSKEYAKLGFSRKEILGVTKATLDLAAATGSELARSAEVVGSTIRAFNLSAEDSQRVVDVMAKSFSSSALDMEKFAVAMRNVASVAKNAGLGIEETTALLGVLTDRGIDASSAGTGLRNVFLRLTKQGLSFDEAMKMINESTDKNKLAMELFGTKGAIVGTILAETGNQAAILTAKLNNAGGAAKKMADTQLDTLTGKSKLMTSAWEGLILAFDSSTGVISSTAGAIIGSLTTLFTFLSKSTKSMADEFFELQEEVSNLETSLNPLLDRYDELNDKTELSVEEQTELESIIQQVADIVPLAVTEFDKYGKALGISTSAAREFIEEQKAMLKITNAEAIEEQKDAIEGLNNSLKVSNLTLEKVNGKYKELQVTFTRGGRAISKYIELTNEEILKRSQARKEIGKEIDARNAVILKLQGEKTQAEIAVEAAQKAAKEKADLEAELSDKIIKSTKKTDKEKKKTVKAFTSFFAEALAIEAEEEEFWSRDSVKRKNEAFALDIKLLNGATDLAKKELEIRAVNEEVANSVFLNLELARLRAELELNIIYGEDTVDIERSILETKHELRLQASEVKKEDQVTELESDQANRDLTLEAEMAALDVLSNAFSAFIQLRREQADRDTQASLDSASNKADTELNILQNQLDKGIISEDEFANKKLAIDKKREAAELKIKKAAFEKKRKLDQALVTFEFAKELASIAAAAAANPANFATYGAAGTAQYAILAAVAAANFGINTALIQGAQFAKGGILQGPSHAQGGIKTPFGEMQGGEAVINVESTNKHRALLSAINVDGGGVPFEGVFSPVRHMAHGGILGRPSPSSADIGSGSDISRIFELMAQQTDNIIRNIRVENVVTETASKLDEVIGVENLVTLG